MSVTRYEVNGPSSVFEDEAGSLVDYKDFAALEQRLIESERYGRQTDITIDNLELKLAQMAAENAGLKAAALGEIEVINRGGQAYCVKDGMSVNPIYARGWNDYRAKSLSVETPETDAFLAEVRSSAVDEVCLKISKAIINCYQDEQVGLDAAATICGDFASLIRKGVQS